MGIVLTNKYAEGLPGKRYYGGCQYVDVVENASPLSALCKLFGAEMCQCAAPLRRPGQSRRSMSRLLKPGDTVLGMSAGTTAAT